MTKTLFAMSAIAALAMTAAVSPASAGQVGASIRVADLDLSTPADAARFQQRVETAATHLCVTASTPLESMNACRQAVREEAVAQLDGTRQRQLQLALNRSTRVAERQAFGF